MNTHSLQDLDQAIAALEVSIEVVRTPPALDRLCGLVEERFKQRETIGDLGRAIMIAETISVDITSKSRLSSDLFHRNLERLQRLYETRYATNGAIGDLDKAISSTELALFIDSTKLSERPDATNANQRSIQLYKIAGYERLSLLLRTRYFHEKDVSVIKKAINCAAAAFNFALELDTAFLEIDQLGERYYALCKIRDDLTGSSEGVDEWFKLWIARSIASAKQRWFESEANYQPWPGTTERLPTATPETGESNPETEMSGYISVYNSAMHDPRETSSGLRSVLPFAALENAFMCFNNISDPEPEINRTLAKCFMDFVDSFMPLGESLDAPLLMKKIEDAFSRAILLEQKSLAGKVKGSEYLAGLHLRLMRFLLDQYERDNNTHHLFQAGYSFRDFAGMHEIASVVTCNGLVQEGLRLNKLLYEGTDHKIQIVLDQALNIGDDVTTMAMLYSSADVVASCWIHISRLRRFKFELTGDLKDLAGAINAMEFAIEKDPNDKIDKPKLLEELEGFRESLLTKPDSKNERLD